MTTSDARYMKTAPPEEKTTAGFYDVRLIEL